MAEGGVTDNIRYEWHSILEGLKSTVEGLLAAPSSNVWNAYGGLERLCGQLCKIMNHRLKVTQGQHGSSLDFWNFVRGLRWLNPISAPSIEQFHKMTRGGASSHDSVGRMWLRQSLLDHNLAGQLEILVRDQQHLHKHYYDDAYLTQADYFHALIVCLRAVENNTGALLADINPILLLRQHTSSKAAVHRSASLPLSSRGQYGSDMRRAATLDRLVPSPVHEVKSRSTLMLFDEDVQPCNIGTSPEESARDALRNVLNKSGSIEDDSDDFSFYNTIHRESSGDPLLNIEILSRDHGSLCVKKSSSFSINSEKQSSAQKRNGRQIPHHKNGSSKKAKLKSRTSELLDNILNSDSNVSTISPTTSYDLRKSCDVVTTINESPETWMSPTTCLTTSVSKDSGFSSQPTVVHATLLKSSVSDSCPVLSDDTREPQNVDSGQYLHHHHNAPSQSQSQEQSSLKNARTDQKGYSDQSCDQVETNQKPKDKDGDAKPSTSNTSNGAAVQKKYSHARSVSDFGVPRSKTMPHFSQQVMGRDNVPLRHADSTSLSTSLPSNEYINRKEGYFRQPAEGQSLLSFLSSQDFHTCAELDKENAHFSISEALIAAIEQMKWNQVLRPHTTSDDVEEGDSDEEIQVLKQRIRIRRRERMTEKAQSYQLPAFSDGRTDTTITTTTSGSPLSSSPMSSSGSLSGTDSSDEVHDTDINDGDKSSEGNLTSLRESGLSLSMASLYSDLELQKSNANLERSERLLEASGTNGSLLSAESVAISLIRRFSEKQLPKASDLDWLVSEQDAPQALLPLPDSYPVSPDDHDNRNMRLRGNLEWAPPRAQIVFNIHPTPKRQVILAKQNFRCAGCGARVEQGYMKRYRYCEYLGKYFCPCCHVNDLAHIPGRVLKRWDHTQYYVSHFARDLLSRIHHDPLFNIEDTNPGLYRKVRSLDQVREARQRLRHLHPFITTCRLADSAREVLSGCAPHWMSDTHTYSMSELMAVKKGVLAQNTQLVVEQCVQHVTQCQLCQVKGFICELCDSDDIIFPFDLGNVTKCPACRACFHSACYDSTKCPKCARIEARRCLLEADSSPDEDLAHDR